MRRVLALVSLAISLPSTASQTQGLFPYERVQLTRQHLQSLPEDDAKLFAFDEQRPSTDPDDISTTERRCRYMPGDDKWPADKSWHKLAKQLSAPDRLIKAVPQAAVCYPGPLHDDATCQILAGNWSSSYTHMDHPTEVLSPVFTGLTCLPPTLYNSGNCSLGGYPAYVIDAETVQDVQVGVNFARNSVVRLVVKNTGHDFAGKSTGAGALSVWTHGMKDMQYISEYADESGYAGPAIKAGAGAQAFELYKFASDNSVVVVAGEGETVGVMGGYILGGGHSPLSSLYGIAADHVLEFQVVTPQGKLVTANAISEPDLFWALRGGGGSTFGVVTSVTVKAYPDMHVTTATWALDSSSLGKDKFWAVVKAYFDNVITHVDAGTYSYYTLMSFGNMAMFRMQPFFAPNQTASQVTELLRPLVSTLAALNVSLSPKITEYPSFYPAWRANFALEFTGSTNGAPGSRLFPRSNFATETSRNITFNTLKQTAESGHAIIAFSMAPTLARGGNPDNAVNPAWRSAVMHAISAFSWPAGSSTSTILTTWKNFTFGTMQKWRDITPGSGSYLNEADRLEPEWQQSFWGDKYKRLLKIKKTYDKRDLFWAVNAVGSEGWRVESVDGLPNENGRLCKVEGNKEGL